MVHTRHVRPSALRRFLDNQSSAGLLLMAAAVVALILANSPLGSGYAAVLSAYVVRSPSVTGSTTG